MASLFKSTFTIHHCTGDWEQQYYHSANSFAEAKKQARTKLHPGISLKSTKCVLDLMKLCNGKFIEVSKQETPNSTP